MIVLIVVITAIALASVMTGINVGIKTAQPVQHHSRVYIAGNCFQFSVRQGIFSVIFSLDLGPMS